MFHESSLRSSPSLSTSLWTLVLGLLCLHCSPATPSAEEHPAQSVLNGQSLALEGMEEPVRMGSSRSTRAMATARAQHTGTLLPSGKVLVTGGSTLSGNATTGVEVYDPATGTWASTGALASARYLHTATRLPNGKVLIAGGLSGFFGSAMVSAEVYDPATGTWAATGALSNARYGQTATLLPSGKVLVLGGYNGSNALKSAEMYDPATGTWAATGSMSIARTSQTTILLPSGKVLVLGGVNEGNALSSVEVYDPATGTWASAGNLAVARSSHRATLMPSGKVLVAGGLSNATGLNSAEVYDPATGTSTATGAMNVPHYDNTMTLLPSGKVFVAGGPSQRTIEEYNPATGTWTITGSLSAGRDLAAATLLPLGKVLIAGGSRTNPLSSAELYDPEAGAWASTDALTTARDGHTATLLPSSKVLVAGGSNGSGALSSAEVRDAETGTWTSTGSLSTARARHTAILLPSGKVLVAGGSNGGGALASAEMYDPTTGVWSSVGAMGSPREGHTATLLQNGKVLVAGGRNGSALAHGEVYDPATGTWTPTGPMDAGRDRHTATLLPDGKVLVVGGYNSDVRFSAEVYDPEAGTWALTGRLNISRYSHTATRLPSGRVLVAGGDSGGGYVQRTEEYDPARGIWLLTGSLATGRVSATATLLPSGKVFVAGGHDGTSALSSVEVYDMASGNWAASGSSLTTPRKGHAAALLPSGKVLVTGGANNDGPLTGSEMYEDTGALDAWRPVFHHPDLRPGAILNLTGTGFRGVSEASSGSTQSSATNFPMLTLMAVEGGAQTGMPQGNYSDTGVVTAVPSVPNGYYFLTAVTNAIPGGRMVLVQGLPLMAPVVVTPAQGALVTTATPLFSGTTEVGSRVSLSLDGGAAQAAVVDGAGNWSFIPSSPLSQGTHAVTAQATDAAGNTSPASSPRSFSVDSVAPNAPVVVTPANGALLNTATPVFSGTTEVGSRVSLSFDGGAARAALVDGAGNWSFTPSGPLAQGTHAVTAQATDAAGNTSPASSPRSFTVDSVAPNAPVVVTPANGVLLNTATPVFSGTTEVGSRVSLSFDGGAARAALVDGAGNWSFTPSSPLSQGMHLFTTQATDAAGNTSPTSPPRSFTVDSVAPVAPGVVTPAQGALVTTATPVFSGTTEVGSRVSLSLDGGGAQAAVVDGAGNWSFIPSSPLSQGTHAVTAQATDAAGNTSPASSPRSFSVDSVAPNAPVVVTPANGALLNTATPVFSGTTEVGSRVSLSLDGGAAQAAVVDGAGNWSFTPSSPLTQGAHSVTAQATDAAGNTSPASPPRSFSVDSVAPDAPVVVTPANGALLNTATPVFSGTTEVGSRVALFLDGGAAQAALVDGAGNWSFTPSSPLAQGAHSVTAQATDAAGNTSPASPPHSFSVDSVAPDAPVVVSPAAGALLTTTAPVFSGTTEVGSQVALFLDGGAAVAALVDGAGNWSFTPSSPLSQGAHSVTAQATDAAGNTSPASPPHSFSVDSVAPDAPVVVSPAAGEQLDTLTPVFSGTAEPGSTVILSIDGEDIGSTRANNVGTWSFEVTEPLSLGSHTLVARGVDAVGNPGLASAPTSFTIRGPPSNPPHRGGCSSAPTATAGWMGVLGIICLRRRWRWGAAK